MRRRARRGRVRYLVTAHMPRTSRLRDVENIRPTIKACVDGITDYGVTPDDSDRWVAGIDLRRGDVSRSPMGHLAVEIIAVDAVLVDVDPTLGTVTVTGPNPDVERRITAAVADLIEAVHPEEIR